MHIPRNYMTSVYFIEQLRLDFNMFAITGPSTETNSEFDALNGQIASSGSAAGKKASFNTVCEIDWFSVSNPGGTTPPVICGTNTGKHSEETYQK